MTADTFTCARCGRTFDKDWSDEEARAEAEAAFSAAELEETSDVCDDCHKALMAAMPRLRAQVDQEAAAAGMPYGEYVRMLAREEPGAR